MQLFIRVHVEFVVIDEKIYQTKTVGFQNTKILEQSKIEEKKLEMKGTLIHPKFLMKGLSMRKVC